MDAVASPQPVGIVFPPSAPPDSLPGFARRAERLGFDSVWLIEDCFLAGGLVMAATALACTERLRVGVGLMPVGMRNPALAAMEIGALARLHPGRFIATFGHGVRGWMEQIGALPEKRLQALREATGTVRLLLHGRKLTAHGFYVRLEGVALDPPPEVPPPVLIGSTGPRGIGMSAQVGDGFLLPEGTGVSFIAQAVNWARTNSSRDPLAVVYTWLSLDGDAERAREALRPSLAGWAKLRLYPEAYASAGVDPETVATAPITAALAAELALAGDAAACADAARRRFVAGADQLILFAVGDDAITQYERFAIDVLPALGGPRTG